MKETLTPEQKEIALREMEAKDESEIENATEANG